MDCVIFGFDFEKLNVILVERVLEDPKTKELLISDYTLTGNHALVDEPLEEAARRVLYDLTGLQNIFLKQYYTTGDPDRLMKETDQLWLKSIGKNPADRVVSVCFFSLLNCKDVELKKSNRNAAWHPVREVSNLGFDDADILEKALVSLQIMLQNEPIGFEMLPEKFTLSQLQRLYEEVFGIKLDKRNFRKKVSKVKYIVPLEEKQKGVAHKPARYYKFSNKTYLKSKKEGLNFAV